MSLKQKLIILYILVGLQGVAFVEFHNFFIKGRSWEYILKYNLPFVLFQNVIFVIAYYLFTVRRLKGVLSLDMNAFHTLDDSKREYLFKRLVRFPYDLFRFSIIFMVSLAIMFHIYQAILTEKITEKFIINVLISFLREQSLGLIITLTVMAVLGKMLRPFILALKQPHIEKIQVSLVNKIYIVFFSILFIFIADIIWLFVYSDEPVNSLLIKTAVTLLVLTILAIVYIRLTIFDSFLHIQDVGKSISDTKDKDPKSLHSIIPITSSDEIAYLVGNFNNLQGKIQNFYKDVDEELKIAYNVQNHLLPSTFQYLEHIKIQGLSTPMKEVGGDFFDIVKINEKKLGVLIGDVSGKGLSAALFMSVMIGMSKGRMNDESYTPVTLLQEFNQLLVPMLREGMYVTAGVAFIDLESQTLTYASAGHVSPIISSKTKTFLLEQSSLPLGIDPDESYGETVVPLEDIEAILFYTDGIVEQRNVENEMYGFARLCKLFAENKNKDASLLIQDVLNFSKDNERMDDMTIVNIRNICKGFVR